MAQAEIVSGRGAVVERPVRRRRGWRALGAGCLVLLLVLCVGVGSLAVALRSGPLQLSLPGSSSLKIGSDNFVLSNYSFQSGTTYFADLNGNGVRTILELRRLEDSKSLEIAVHSSTGDSMREDHIVTLPLP
jgi:hypothetical protein